jgi:hypothetical protein
MAGDLDDDRHLWPIDLPRDVFRCRAARTALQLTHGPAAESFETGGTVLPAWDESAEDGLK